MGVWTGVKASDRARGLKGKQVDGRDGGRAGRWTEGMVDRREGGREGDGGRWEGGRTRGWTDGRVGRRESERTEGWTGEIVDREDGRRIAGSIFLKYMVNRRTVRESSAPNADRQRWGCYKHTGVKMGLL